MYLDEILQHHRRIAADDARPLDALVDRALTMPASRGFVSRLQADSISRLAVIAEIKRRSPSRGALREDLDPAIIATSYALGGASCLSVLTDERFFGGSSNDLQSARGATTLPVIRKDFTVSARDVCDARIMGADCVLLIVAALSRTEVIEYHQLACQIGLDVLVEIHDERELEVALEARAIMVGVNQRDLVTFEVDHDRAVRMVSQIPANVMRVAESGVRGRADAQRLRDAGFNAVLVGESLVTAPNVASAVDELRVSFTI